MFKEIKVALRALAQTPGFTAIAVVTVALAIGATTAVFSLINALLIRPLPYHQPSRLVLIWEQFLAQDLERIPVSAPEYLDYEKALKSTEQLAAFDYTSFNLTEGDVPERISGAVVSPRLFPLLGVQPIRGRTFAQEEQGEGRDTVVLISERLWKRRFNADPTLVGKTLTLNGRSFTVIGVIPASFEFPIPLFGVQGNRFGDRVDIWKPIAFTPVELKARYSRSYAVVGRLRPGVGLSTLQAELDNVVAGWLRQFPDNYGASNRFGARAYALQEQVVGGMRNGLAILLGAVVGVLLIACANLATMLLARSSARERELAIRVALGAGTWRLLRQLLTESVLLSLAGAVAGLLLSIWGLDVLVRLGARTVPRLSEVSIDVRVLCVTAVLGIATGIVFGLIPALASAKPELTEALKEGGRGSTSGARTNNIRNSLVVIEVALALVLLISAGLLIKSYIRLQNVNPGFNSHHVLTMELSLPKLKYPSPTGGSGGGKRAIDFFGELNQRVARLPGVQAAGAASILPLSGTNSDSSFSIEGAPMNTGGPGPDEEIRVVTPDYFRVLQIPLLAGRLPNDGDTADAPPVVVINHALAAKYFPKGDALNKRITFDDPRQNPKWVTIIGIVGDVRHRGLDVDAQPEYYVPHTFFPERDMILAVRSEQDPRLVVSAIRREVQAIDAEQPIANVRTLDVVTAESIAPRRLSVVLIGVFASIALLLAGVGTYGVISYLVVQRTHEIGVRMALGAQRADVLRLVVGHALKLVGIGTAIGLVVALLSSRALSALLYNVNSYDLATFAIVTVVLAASALLASYIPALRATRADPMIALSHNA